MRYYELFLETPQSEANRQRTAAEQLSRSMASANRKIENARNEDDQQLQSAKIQSANAQKRTAQARFRKETRDA